MEKTFEEVATEVETNTSVANGTTQILTTLKQELDLAIGEEDWDAITEISEELGANIQRLSDAVVANTAADEEI